MDILKLLNNNTTGLTEEEKVFAENFNNNLRENIIAELASYDAVELINKSKSDLDEFKEILNEIFINGKKGYKDITTKVLIDIYLEKKGELEFIKIIDEISKK